ncbi:MAG: hypothetical protein ACP6IP_09580 [Candidatus Njordarchaeia archaeon]
MTSPSDFLDIARYLAKEKPISKEIAIRTAINRLYFCTFLNYRDIIDSIIKNNANALYEGAVNLWGALFRDASIHTIVLNIIRENDTGLADLYFELRKMRNTCDYNLNKKITEKHFIDANDATEILLNSVKTFSTTLKNSIIKDGGQTLMQILTKHKKTKCSKRQTH